MNIKKQKLIRITTVPISLKILLSEQLKFMNNYFEVIGVSSEGKELKEVEEKEEIGTISLNMSREITPFKDLVSLIKMILLILREKPDIVHTHTPKAGIIGMLASYICRVPNRLHTVAGLPVMEAEGKKKKILLLVERLTYACATKVYPNSKGLEEYILNNKLTSKDKLKVIGYGSSNGIDTNYFKKTDEIIEKSKEIKKEYKLENKFVFSFVGRIVKDKGINELVYSFEKLTKDFNNISLLLVGDYENVLDPISNRAKKIINENKDIIEAGYQNDIRPFLSSSDCFVLPTYREGFPNVVLQASSMELPCIVTDINGCNEIIQHNINGLIIKSKSEDNLYKAMRQFLDDKNLKNKLSANSRNDIIVKYDRKQFFNFLLDEYNEVIND